MRTGSRLKSDGRRARSVAMMTHRPVMGSLRSSGNFDESLYSAGVMACTLGVLRAKCTGEPCPRTGYYSVRLGRKASRSRSILGGLVSKMLTMSNRMAPQSTPARLA